MGSIHRGVKIAVAVILTAGALFVILAGRDYTKATKNLDSLVVGAVKECGLGEQNFLYGKQERGKSGRHTFLKITRRYEVNSGFDFDRFEAVIDGALRGTGFKRIKSMRENGPKKEERAASFAFKNRIIYEISFLKKKYKHALKSIGVKAKIAIVLDDFGYNMNNLNSLYGINTPLTISVLPNLPYSQEIAQDAAAKNIEVILHLPLEPKGNKDNIEKGTIMVDMPQREVKSILANALESVPGVKGVSNHMGSRATEDKDLMKVIFSELGRRHLYFLDSLTADDSVCEESAAKAGVRAATRSVFLDNELDEGYIENQLRRTAEIAKKTGRAIGIGHDKSATVRVMARVIPELKDEGFQFVYISELVK